MRRLLVVCVVIAAGLVAGPALAWDGSQSLEPGLSGADLLLFEDFEAQDFGTKWPVHWGSPPGSATVTGPAKYVFNGKRALLLQGKQDEHASVGSGEYVPAAPAEAVYYRLYYRLEDGFSIGTCNQIKLFGIRGGATIADAYGGAGKKPTGNDKFSALLGVHDKMDLHFYYYHPDQPGGYGDNTDCDVTGQVATLAPGKWYCLELMLKLNTVGKKDGQLRAWLDDTLVGKVDNLRFRDDGALKIRRFTVLSYFGGSGQTNTSPKDQRTFVDNLVISKTRVGCLAGPTPDGGAPDAVTATDGAGQPGDGAKTEDGGPAGDSATDSAGDSPDDGCSCRLGSTAPPREVPWGIVFMLVFMRGLIRRVPPRAARSHRARSPRSPGEATRARAR